LQGVIKKLKRFITLLNNQPDALIIQIYSIIKLHVSGISSAHHQEFSTVHSALVSFMQVFDDRFQAESGWNWLEVDIKNLVCKRIMYCTGRTYRFLWNSLLF
jgi:hypothetical protein